ncbi:EF-hand domain-containing protein [Sulfuritalea sp.]|uniref:EF-hand domain-containing protein n=1 Tax=Sulfuritalea sp. TaxID=2480090 RepID=UPI00286E793B|nr:EF-hand domain-containing protein [Sulfuritalea sp.]
MAQFDGTDADKDGRLAREEVARQSRYLTDNFDRLDTSKDGYLSWEEFIGHDRWPK